MFPASEKLEVGGSVKADSFIFTNPRTNYYSLDATAFTADQGSVEVRKQASGHGAYMVGNTFTLVAPLNLPHNAIITSLTAYVFDISPSADLSVNLVRRDNSSTRTIMGTINSSGNSGELGYTINFPNIPVYVVDNLQYSYMLTVSVVTSPYTWPTNGELEIAKVRVAYILADAQ